MPSTLYFMAPKAGKFGDLQVAQNRTLAGQPQAGRSLMGREVQTPAFDAGRRRDRAFDAYGTGATGTQATAVDGAGDAVVQGQAGRQQDSTQIGTGRALDSAAGEGEGRHRIVPQWLRWRCAVRDRRSRYRFA